MSQELLDGPQVRAARQQVRGEAMPQAMRRNLDGKPGFLDVLLHRPLHTSGREPALLAGFVIRIRRLPRVADEHGFPIILPALEVPAQPVGSRIGEKHDARTPAFADDAELPPLQIDLVAVKGDQLRHAKAGGKQKFEDRLIPKSFWGTNLGHVEESLHLFPFQKFYASALGLPQLHRFRRRHRNPAFDEKLKKRPEGNEVIVLRDPLEADTRRIHVARQKQSILADFFRGNGGGGGDLAPQEA